jgi:glycosyltransferase involved in cell wall biosynthesis
MEAMAAGIPVVTTRNSGSLVRDGVEGFIRDYDDIEGFVDVLQKLNDDRELLLTMGRAARQRILGYDLERYQKSLTAFLKPPA